MVEVLLVLLLFDLLKKKNAVIETLGPKLAPLEVTHADQISELNQITKQVSEFMERYNHTVSFYNREAYCALVLMLFK